MDSGTNGQQIRVLTASERQDLAVVRASAWRGALTVEQFVERNRILYGGEFAEKRIRSYGLFLPESRMPVASCDFIEGDCYTVSGKERTHVLASALTLPEFQKRGYMSQLLGAAFSKLPHGCFLYSDIGPVFYRRYGFSEDIWEEVVEAVPAALLREPMGWEATAKGEFLQQIDQHRARRVMLHVCDVTFVPDGGWLDWVEQKYDYYRTLSGDGGMYYGRLKTEFGPVPTAMFADCVNRRLDILWGDPEWAGAWRHVAYWVAAKHGLKSIRFWARSAGGKRAWPMFHSAPGSHISSITPDLSTDANGDRLGAGNDGRPLRLDLNLGDWW